MTAPITTASPLAETARAILAGTAFLYDEQPLYGAVEWRDAADYLLDTGDESEMAAMLRRQAQFDACAEWRASALSEREAERREFVSFEAFAKGVR